MNPLLKAMLEIWLPLVKKLAVTPVAWLVLILFLILAVSRVSVVKGWLGEKLVSLWLKLLLNRRCYTVIDNVTIRDGQGGTTQIDHVVASPYGVFVIETKNMGGWIFGSEGEATWTQKFRRPPSRSFQNPLRQNYKHTETLAEVLGIAREALFSVIVFVGNSHFKTAMPPNVTYGLGCIRLIRSRQEALFAPGEVTRLVAAIEQLRLAPNLKTHRQHVAYLRGREQAAATPAPEVQPAAAAAPVGQAPAERSCPQCGNALVLRTARQGARAGTRFWGCAAYPECRHTEDAG